MGVQQASKGPRKEEVDTWKEDTVMMESSEDSVECRGEGRGGDREELADWTTRGPPDQQRRGKGRNHMQEATTAGLTGGSGK